MNYLLFNPKARNGKTAEDLALIHKALQSQQIREYNLANYSDYGEILKYIRPDDTVYLVGGDGTLNHFINELNKFDMICDIYFYSAGTGNDFKRDVDPDNHVYRVKINKYIKNLPNVEIENRTYKFINGVGYGIDGYACVEGDNVREKTKRNIKYSKMVLKGMFGRYKSCSGSVTVDGITHKYKKIWFASTMFGRFYGGGVRVAPKQSRFNVDHTLTCVVLHDVSRLGLFFKYPKIIKGKHSKCTDCFDFFVGHKFEVEFDKARPIQIDGEAFENISKYTAEYN